MHAHMDQGYACSKHRQQHMHQASSASINHRAPPCAPRPPVADLLYLGVSRICWHTRCCRHTQCHTGHTAQAGEMRRGDEWRYSSRALPLSTYQSGTHLDHISLLRCLHETGAGKNHPGAQAAPRRSLQRGKLGLCLPNTQGRGCKTETAVSRC